MKTIRSIIVLCGTLLFMQGALAQDDVTGAWNMNVDTPQGPMAITFNLNAEGMDLTGNMSIAMMGEMPISEGMAHGNEVKFKVVMGMPGGPAMVINYTGVVTGDSMELTSEFEGETPPGVEAGPQTMTATRGS